MDYSKEQEDTITKEIETQTVKIPSDVFLFSAIGAIGVSFGLRYMKQKGNASFVGQWVAPILLLGVYNKLVKQAK
jgi:hypothetical protein